MYNHKLCLAAIGFALLSTAAAAVTRTVHSTSGPYTSVNAALAAADPGDVIEVTDNSTTFSENLYITKDNITIQGQASLDPKPVIQGVWQQHPLYNSTTAPQKWWWTASDANSAVRIFDDKGAVVINAAVGLTLRDLHIKCEPTSSTTGSTTTGLLDFRFGTSGLVEDCYLDGSGVNAAGAEIAGADRATLTANNHTFRNCTFYRGNVALEHHGGTGTLRIEDSLVTGSVHSLYFFGGTVEVVGTEVVYDRSSNSARTFEIGNAYGSVNATFQDCLVRKLKPVAAADQFFHLRLDDRGAAFGADNYNTGRWAPGDIQLAIDNCDLIGPQNSAVSRLIDTSTDRVNWNLKSLILTDNNFYNIAGTLYSAASTIPYRGNHYMGAGTATLFEDYNVFKQTLNTASFAGIVSGGHSIVLDAGQPLYVDVDNGNYQLASNSPAATLNSSGTPAFTGSQGVSATNVPASVLTVGHSGGTYTSIKAALLAARQGDLVNIIDNSAPYNENLDLITSTGVTLQGDPSLNPRPTIRGTGIPKPFLFTTTVHNITLRNLILDSSLTAGTNSTVFENQRAGTVTALHNVRMIGGATTLYGIVQDACSLQMTNCELTMVNAARPGILKRKTGVCELTSTTITSADRAVEHYAGKLLLKNSKLISGAGNAILVPHNTTHGSTMMLEVYDSLVRSTATAGSSALIRLDSSTFRRFFSFDNCDLIGSEAGFTTFGVDAQTTLTHAAVVDTIHTNFSNTSYNLGQPVTSVIPGLTFNSLSNWENFNVYKQAPNTLDTQGGIRGANNLYLASVDPLYTHPAGADYRLRPSSAATTLNSIGMPPYAGSQGIGVEGPSSVQSDWALYN